MKGRTPSSPQIGDIVQVKHIPIEKSQPQSLGHLAFTFTNTTRRLILPYSVNPRSIGYFINSILLCATSPSANLSTFRSWWALVERFGLSFFRMRVPNADGIGECLKHVLSRHPIQLSSHFINTSYLKIRWIGLGIVTPSSERNIAFIPFVVDWILA